MRLRPSHAIGRLPSADIENITVLVLATIFILSAAGKILNLSGFLEAIESYSILPKVLIFPVAVFIIASEFVIAEGLLIKKTRYLFSIILIVLMLIYSTAIFYSILKGRTIRCGCYFIAVKDDVADFVVLGRNLTVILLATQILIKSSKNLKGYNPLLCVILLALLGSIMIYKSYMPGPEPEPFEKALQKGYLTLGDTKEIRWINDLSYGKWRSKELAKPLVAVFLVDAFGNQCCTAAVKGFYHGLMQPTIAQIAGDFIWVKVEDKSISQTYGVGKVPYVVVFNEDEVVWKGTAHNAESLYSIIDAALKLLGRR